MRSALQGQWQARKYSEKLSTMNKDEDQLIHEKITVPDDAPRTSRPRLLKMLADNMSAYNATIINGRAGTGKTTLAADFARMAARPVCWYKVDAADDELNVFCRYLAAAMSLQRPSLDQDRLLQMTETVESDRAELLAEAFVFELGEHGTEPLLLIIEDLHLVYDADWVVPFFHRLLPLLPTDVHVLITCRSLPPAPLWRLRSKQMLRVMEESELTFNLEETTRLFETYGLSKEHARIALRDTNGRASAVINFADTPGLAGRAVADNFLNISAAIRNPLGHQTPDFQT